MTLSKIILCILVLSTLSCKIENSQQRARFSDYKCTQSELASVKMQTELCNSYSFDFNCFKEALIDNCKMKNKIQENDNDIK